MMEVSVPSAGSWTAKLQAPLVALEFLTLMRLRRPPLVADDVMAASAAFFPAVGLLLGGILAGADWLLRDAFGSSLTGWLLAALLLALTGGLHADGLADTFDGLLGGRTPERRLAIMRDSSIGAFGACALVVVLALKATAFASLGAEHRTAVLLMAPCLSRAACVAAIAAFPYARASGAGSAIGAGRWSAATVFALGTAAAAAVAALGATGMAAGGVVVVAGLMMGAFAWTSVGGLTGDVYGTVIELTETLALVTAVGVL
jgi:adenosylcobinamide-GDP ribazoletransferase